MLSVIPAQAGIHNEQWIPAYAGMTMGASVHQTKELSPVPLGYRAARA